MTVFRIYRAVYLPTQILNFSIVPPHLRLVTICGVSLFWSAFLSCLCGIGGTDVGLCEDTYLSVANARQQKREEVIEGGAGGGGGGGEKLG